MLYHHIRRVKSIDIDLRGNFNILCEFPRVRRRYIIIFYTSRELFLPDSIIFVFCSVITIF